MALSGSRKAFPADIQIKLDTYFGHHWQIKLYFLKISHRPVFLFDVVFDASELPLEIATSSSSPSLCCFGGEALLPSISDKFDVPGDEDRMLDNNCDRASVVPLLLSSLVCRALLLDSLCELEIGRLRLWCSGDTFFWLFVLPDDGRAFPRAEQIKLGDSPNKHWQIE